MNQHALRKIIENLRLNVWVKRRQLKSGTTGDRCSGDFYPKVGCVCDEPVANFDDFDLRHGQSKPSAQASGKHLIRQYSQVLWIVLELADVVGAIGCAHQMRLRAAAHLADVLYRIEAVVHMYFSLAR